MHSWKCLYAAHFLAVCVGTPYQIGYLGMPNRSGPTAFWDFYSPLLGELGQPNLIRINLGFKSSFPQFLHSHIHTYAVTHNRFLFGSFRGACHPWLENFFGRNKWTIYRGVRHEKIGISTVALQLSGLNICYFPPILPFGSARLKVCLFRVLVDAA